MIDTTPKTAYANPVAHIGGTGLASWFNTAQSRNQRGFFVRSIQHVSMSGWVGSRKTGRCVLPVGQPIQSGTQIGLCVSGLQPNTESIMNAQSPSATAPTIFQFNQKFQVRVIVVNNEPWFCLSDVCKILELDRTSNLIQSLDKGGVVKNHTPTQSGNQDMKFISEPNLYRVIFRSNKPEAKQFQDWVFNDVLPSIRKTGSYQRPTENPPAAKERISNRQYHELKQQVWLIEQCFHQTGSANHWAWAELRKRFLTETGANLPAERYEEAKAALAEMEAKAMDFKRVVMEAEKTFFKTGFQATPAQLTLPH